MLTLSGAVLDPLLRDNPAGPRITYYDDAIGERVELSTATLANWAAKTANLLRDELYAGPGSQVAVLLPAHWQTRPSCSGCGGSGQEVMLAASRRGTVAPRTGFDEADTCVGVGEIAVLSLTPWEKCSGSTRSASPTTPTAVRAHGDQIVPESLPGPALAGRSVDTVVTEARDSAASAGLTGAGSSVVGGQLGHPPPAGRQPFGGVHRRRIVDPGRQPRSGRPGPAPGHREGDARPRLICVDGIAEGDPSRWHGPAGFTNSVGLRIQFCEYQVAHCAD